MMKPKTKKVLIWISSIIAGFVLIAAGFCLFVSYLVFDKENIGPKNANANPLYFTMKAAQIQRQMRDCENPAEIKTVVFSENELNSFFYMGASIYNAYLQKKHETASYQPIASAEFKDGLFTVYYSIKTSFSTPFGSIINIPVTFSVGWKNNKPVIQLRKIMIGKKNISPESVEPKMTEKLEKVFQKTEVTAFMNAIVSLKIENNKLIVQYRPAALTDAIDQVVFRDSGVYKRTIRRKR